jgi:3',5'-cyclic AMP phosphodiesterase CpdA
MLLLHLSDIHFRKGEVGAAMDPNAHLRNELLRDAEACCHVIGKAPEAVLISGDIAFGGDPAEYAYALKWLQELCTRCGTKLDTVFTIPGNHDVVRGIASRPIIQVLHRDIKAASDLTLDSLLRGLLNDPETKRLLYQALGPYNEFATQFFCDLLPPERTITTRDLRLDDRSILRLSGFNSTFVSSTADKAGDLFVDPACFQLKRTAGVDHLTMCHHPYSWLRQGVPLKDHLNDVARIHLFGHVHVNRIELSRDYVCVAASAAHPDRAEPGWEPGYNLIELNVLADGSKRVMNIGAHVRVWQNRPGQFRAKMDRENDVFRHSIRLEDWAPPAASGVALADAPEPAEAGRAEAPKTVTVDSMDSLRDIGVRFFKLTLSQKSAIAGKLNLLEEQDANQPDFERFRRAFIRARDRGLVDELDREVTAAAAEGR